MRLKGVRYGKRGAGGRETGEGTTIFGEDLVYFLFLEHRCPRNRKERLCFKKRKNRWSCLEIEMDGDGAEYEGKTRCIWKLLLYDKTRESKKGE